MTTNVFRIHAVLMHSSLCRSACHRVGVEAASSCKRDRATGWVLIVGESAQFIVVVLGETAARVPARAHERGDRSGRYIS